MGEIVTALVSSREDHGWDGTEAGVRTLSPVASKVWTPGMCGRGTCLPA